MIALSTYSCDAAVRSPFNGICSTCLCHRYILASHRRCGKVVMLASRGLVNGGNITCSVTNYGASSSTHRVIVRTIPQPPRAPPPLHFRLKPYLDASLAFAPSMFRTPFAISTEIAIISARALNVGHMIKINKTVRRQSNDLICWSS